MGRILRRPAAKTDLIGIYRHIAGESPERAAAYLRAIEETPRTLSDAPMIGMRRLSGFPTCACSPAGGT